MKKMQKWIALLLAVLMLSAIFAGCAKPTTTPEQGDTQQADTQGTETADQPAPQPQEGSDAAWDTSKNDEIIVTVINGYYTAGEKKLAEEYTKLHPETKVTVDVVSDNDAYMAKMQSLFSGDMTGTSDIVHANFLTSALGGNEVCFQKNYLRELSDVLDMQHPYQDGLVRDMYNDTVLTEARNSFGGLGIGALPFDKTGISFYYNKTAFEALGLEAPQTWEELLETCQTLRDNGYENPITVGQEASWILASLADAGFRYEESEFLVQPGDAIYDAETMSANDGFVFDDNDLSCDAFTVTSTERMLAARKNDIIHSNISRTSWIEFAKLAAYFPANWIGGGADNITEFETQVSPILLNGAWNVGLILDDINNMPESAQFDWATFNIPDFANAPEGFDTKMRGLYVLGNVMGIVPKNDADHDARVLDFYLYWYSQAGAQMCYEETLSNGNFVQGPCMINGVVLKDELMEKLTGFVVEGAVKAYSSELCGLYQTQEADRPIHNDLINKLTAGEIDIDTFLDGLATVQGNDTDAKIEAGGYDLDPATADTAK
mgnify:FL=1